MLMFFDQGIKLKVHMVQIRWLRVQTFNWTYTHNLKFQSEAMQGTHLLKGNFLALYGRHWPNDQFLESGQLLPLILEGCLKAWL